MAYEALIEALLKEGEIKSREMIESARLEAEDLTRGAKEEAERIEGNKQEELQKNLQMTKARILNRARIEGRQTVLKAKHEILDRVFEKAGERLHQMTRRSDQRVQCRRIWDALLRETLPPGKTDAMTAYVHQDGSEDLVQMFRERGIACEKVSDPDLWFGFRLVLNKGQIILTNSYKARLEKVRPALLTDLQALLFYKGA